MPKILDQVNSPDDLKRLPADELPALADEIRSLIIDVVSKNGGHLASNLGVVELTIALHYVFDSPRDKIIWDVGHQCYTHKILTGRQERFPHSPARRRAARVSPTGKRASTTPTTPATLRPPCRRLSASPWPGTGAARTSRSWRSWATAG